MIVLIAGGTGFIGQALTRDLLSNHHRVMVLSRNRETVRQIFKESVQCLTWEEINIECLKEIDAVINLSGANIGEQRWSLKRQREILESRIHPTQLLAKFCAQLGEKSPILMNASAIGVYDFIPPTQFQNRFYDEDCPIHFGESPHFLAKVARTWEMATWPARDNGARVINTRFGVVLGPGGGVLKKLLPSFKLGLGAKIGSGHQPFTWISLHDAVRALLFILNDPTISGPVNIVSPEIVTQAEFADTLASLLRRPRLLRLPAFIIKYLFGQMGVELLLSGVAVKPHKLITQSFKFEDTLRQALLRSIHLNGS